MLPPVAEDMSRIRHPWLLLEVYIELCLMKSPPWEILIYLFSWVEQRKASIHLCCKKMRIISMSKENMKKVLKMVKLNCVQEVKLSFTQKLSTWPSFSTSSWVRWAMFRVSCSLPYLVGQLLRSRTTGVGSSVTDFSGPPAAEPPGPSVWKLHPSLKGPPGPDAQWGLPAAELTVDTAVGTSRAVSPLLIHCETQCYRSTVQVGEPVTEAWKGTSRWEPTSQGA